MTLMLELPPELETKLVTEAARLGLSVSDYVLRILADGFVKQRRGSADQQEGEIYLSALYTQKEREILQRPSHRTREDIEKLLESNETFADLIEELSQQRAG